MENNNELLEVKVLRILTSRRFVRGKRDKDVERFVLARIRIAIGKQLPLTLVIGFGYHKNPNATSNILPDMAEELAIQKLFQLASLIKEIYPLGMEVKIVTSGRRAELVNGMLLKNTLLYHNALVKLVIKKRWENVIEVISIGTLYDERLDEFQRTLSAERREIELEWNKSSKVDFWKKQIEHASRNILKNGLSVVEVQRKAEKAAFEYIVFRRAEKRIALLERRFPGAIECSYNKGGKNTLTPWTLRKGCITQPWQGPAELIDGKIQVITQKRKELKLSINGDN